MNIGDIIRDIDAEPLLEGKSGDRPDYGKRKALSKSMKSKVKVYNTIKDALSRAGYGSIFSTTRSGRLYVVSQSGWGQKSSGKIAKGFTKGSATPSASWSSIKAHSIRTRKKHGKATNKRVEKREDTLSKQGRRR